MNPMLLQHALRSLCTDQRWVYAVFWRILPRNYPPPQWDTQAGIMDRSKTNKRNWILVWEDGFCNFPACSTAGTANEGLRGSSSSFLSTRQLPRGNDADRPDTMNPELFFKMSHEVYNYGEGLMGKVAVDNSHKWVYREPLENEMCFLSPWQGSLDPHPRTWDAQFKSGIQTIAVVAVQEGVLQLGSTQKIVEDLIFVLYMQRKFNPLHTVPSLFVPSQPASTAAGEGKRRTNELSSAICSNGGYHHGQWSMPEYERALPMPKGHVNGAQFLTPREPWRNSAAGTKRPSEAEPCAYTSGSFDPSRPECPSLPKALNTGHASPQGSTPQSIPPAFRPSMSSLQALLSKLPSVMCLEAVASTGLHPGNGFAVANFTTNRSPFPLPGPVASSSNGHDLPASVARSQNASQFLESFDHLGEFGIQEALENSDSSYNSFLNEICS